MRMGISPIPHHQPGSYPVLPGRGPEPPMSSQYMAPPRDGGGFVSPPAQRFHAPQVRAACGPARGRTGRSSCVLSNMQCCHDWMPRSAAPPPRAAGAAPEGCLELICCFSPQWSFLAPFGVARNLLLNKYLAPMQYPHLLAG